MASTFSSLLRIELIGTGDQSGTWGNTTNTNLGTLIEQAIAGTTTIDVTAANVTLTNFNGSSDQARCAAIKVIGTPGTSRNIIAPALSHIYVVANASDASVVLKTSTSTGLTVLAGDIVLAYYDPTSGVTDFKLVGKASTSANTANTLVLRDGSGNFSAGTITATFVGGISGGSGAFTTLASTGNTTIGDSSLDTLTVNATPTFNVAIPVTSGGTGATSAASALTNLGATTVGGNLFTLANPSAITFLQLNADNSVSALDAASFRTAIGAGSGGGSVTSVSGTGGYGGLTLSGTVTTSGDITLGGTPTGTWPISVTGSSGSTTTATNVAGGGAGRIVYNTGSGATAFVAAGTSNQVLISNGTSAPSWINQSSIAAGSATTATTATSATTATTATNVAGGGAGQIVYNTGSGATSFISAGTTGQVLRSNGTSAPSYGSSITLGSVESPTSTNTVTFSSIPSWVNRITVNLSLVSLVSGGGIEIRVGSGSVSSTGYTGRNMRVEDPNIVSGAVLNSAINKVGVNGNTTTIQGSCVINRLTGNTWVATGMYDRGGDSAMGLSAGRIALGGTLDRVSIVGDVNFDGGSINIMYE